MKKTILALAFIGAATLSFAQKRVTTSAIIQFDASTSIDELPKAENKTVIAAIDPVKGTVQFEAAMKNFAFKNPMMQDHFNSKNWMNSDEHPKATFSGQIRNLDAVNFNKDGNYTATVEGILSIKGKENKVTAPATIIVKAGVITANTEFSIKLADYGIEGAPIAAGKVAKEPKIIVSAEMK
ncbi:MAG: hypothetical protein GC171_11315 [Terrimonas sp.]|nr:hypothetical protein [Terrimonas sp.]